jgi:hypothetical protein
MLIKRLKKRTIFLYEKKSIFNDLLNQKHLNKKIYLFEGGAESLLSSGISKRIFPSTNAKCNFFQFDVLEPHTAFEFMMQNRFTSEEFGVGPLLNLEKVKVDLDVTSAKNLSN